LSPPQETAPDFDKTTDAIRLITQIFDEFGCNMEDMGAVEAAHAIEPHCMLWCIPGVGRGDWLQHAFKLLR